MAVLLGVGTVAVAVLEVDPEVLDRLARQLCDDSFSNGPRERRVYSKLQGLREVDRVAAMLVERRQGTLPEPGRSRGGEELRPAVHRMDGLPDHSEASIRRTTCRSANAR